MNQILENQKHALLEYPLVVVLTIISFSLWWIILEKVKIPGEQEKYKFGNVVFTLLQLLALLGYIIFLIKLGTKSEYSGVLSVIVLYFLIVIFDSIYKLLCKSKKIFIQESTLNTKILLFIESLSVILMFGLIEKIPFFINTSLTIFLGFFISLNLLFGKKGEIVKLNKKIIITLLQENVPFFVVITLLFGLLYKYGVVLWLSIAVGLEIFVVLSVMVLFIKKNFVNRNVSK